MKNQRSKYQGKGFLTLLLLLFSQFSISQSVNSYFKFPVVTEGVYKISQVQVNNLGFQGLDQIAIFGNPGMLPQKLDSADLILRIIPTQKIGDAIYFYLEGPNRIIINEGEIDYQHHLYADTLFYLIGPHTSPPKIPALENQNQDVKISNLVNIQVKKWEQVNILSSGRNWYSDPLFSNQSLSFSFPKPQGSEAEMSLSLKLMGQSLSENNFQITTDGKLLQTATIPAIPNTTYGLKGREDQFQFEFSTTSNSKINISLQYQTGDVNGTGYIDNAILVTRFNSSNLNLGIYYNLNQTPTFVSATGNQKIWKITNPYTTQELKGTNSLSRGDKIIVFDPKLSENIGEIQPIDMNIRQLPIRSPLIIITSKQLISQANRLADHKNTRGIGTKVVLLEDIYDGFGYGAKDISAIRNFLAFHFHHQGQLKNVLLFGKGTFDYKNKIGGRPNLVPTYSSRNSLNPLMTYSSDDYYGFIKYGQGEWAESASGDEVLQIGVGRIPAVNSREAAEMVNKIIAYENEVNIPGDWKRKIAFFADDGDNNIHLQDAEKHALYLNKNHPEFQIKKLYLDRYPQNRTSSGQSSPLAKEAFRKTVEDGVLILNYIGHGNETTLTAEQVFTTRDLSNWTENPLLPLIVTATCEFGRHDSPLIRSGAEEMLFVQNKGAIGMLTTGRPVFSSINFALNKAFIEAVFEKKNGEYLDLGEIFRRTKNNSLNSSFNRNFSLLGDPSLTLALPNLETKIEEVSDINLEISLDTLKAKQVIEIKGRILDPVSKAFIPGANGTFELALFDKPVKVKTLGDENTPAFFTEHDGFLFRGNGEVKDGLFESEVFIPQNIDYNYDLGKILIFAKLNSGSQEGMAAKNIMIGGTANTMLSDQQGPNINLFFGEDSQQDNIFKTTKIPVKAFLEDESGINISPQNIGQDISIRINDHLPVILNSNYLAMEGNYKKGEVRAIAEGFKEGINTVSFEAWDNVGNNSIETREIIVRGSLEVQILEHLTFPNPTSDKSIFRISHNRPQENILAILRVYSSAGNEIFKTQKRYVKAERILEGLEWNFLYNKTKNPAKGVYIYDIELISEVDGTSDKKGGKIVIQ